MISNIHTLWVCGIFPQDWLEPQSQLPACPMIHLEVSWSHDYRKVQTKPKSLSSSSALYGFPGPAGDPSEAERPGFPHSHCSHSHRLRRLSTTGCSCHKAPTCPSITCPSLWFSSEARSLLSLRGILGGHWAHLITARGQCNEKPTEDTWPRCCSRPVQ